MSSIRPVENLNTANKVVGHYIDGQVIIDSDARTQPIYNPATGRITRRVALADQGNSGKSRCGGSGGVSGMAPDTPD